LIRHFRPVIEARIAAYRDGTRVVTPVNLPIAAE